MDKVKKIYRLDVVKNWTDPLSKNPWEPFERDIPELLTKYNSDTQILKELNKLAG